MRVVDDGGLWEGSLNLPRKHPRIGLLALTLTGSLQLPGSIAGHQPVAYWVINAEIMIEPSVAIVAPVIWVAGISFCVLLSLIKSL